MKSIILCLAIICTVQGVPTSRLQQGDAKLGDFPWIVSLQIKRYIMLNQIVTHECGGVLVSKSWVLTSARCVKSNSQFNTVTGITAGFVQQGDPSSQSFTISKIERHPDFNMSESRNPSFNDIALVKLDRDVELNENVKIIKLPETDADLTKDFDFAGWPFDAVGNGAVLQTRNVPFLDYKSVPTTRLQQGDAQLGDFPWIVSLQIKEFIMFNQILAHECGGVLVSKSWVLTSAECVKSNSQFNFVTEITAGFVQQNDPRSQSFTISKIERHPGFNMSDSRNPSFNDIALVKLDRDVELDENVKIIKLPEADADSTKNFDFAGWQFSGVVDRSVLQIQNVPFLDYKSCHDLVSEYVEMGHSDPLDESWDKVYLNETENICTGPKDAKSAVFVKGYEGGPLVQDGVVYGVLSYLLDDYQYHEDYYVPSGIFIRVFNYIDWIKGIVDDL